MLDEKPYILYQVVGEAEYLVCHVTRLPCEDEYRAMLSEIVAVAKSSNLRRVLFDICTAGPQVGMLDSRAFGEALVNALPLDFHIAALVSQGAPSRGFTRMIGRHQGPELATFTNPAKAVAWLSETPPATELV
jgi:hypothetical protein